LGEDRAEHLAFRQAQDERALRLPHFPTPLSLSLSKAIRQG
jgi:hypothetical protein